MLYQKQKESMSMQLSAKARAICNIAEYKCEKCLLKEICLKEYESEEQKAMEMNYQAQFIKQSIIDNHYNNKKKENFFYNIK